MTLPNKSITIENYQVKEARKEIKIYGKRKAELEAMVGTDIPKEMIDSQVGMLQMLIDIRKQALEDWATYCKTDMKQSFNEWRRGLQR